MLKPATYKSLLKDADAVVHSMGILLEADYKGVLTGKESVWSGLSRAFSATKGGSQNPLERAEGEELRPQEKDGQLTYELMNRDSGTLTACTSYFEGILADKGFNCSRHTRTRSLLLTCTVLCLYFSCSRCTYAAETVYHNEA